METHSVIQLRDYQSSLIEECRCAYRSGHRRVCLCSPTGSGKTVLFSFVTKTSLERGQNTMILAHRSEILDQIEATMVSVGVPVGVVRAEEHSPAQGKATIASVQTLVKRFDRTPVPDLVIVDECFPAGTMIDGRPIESIKAGDLVTGWNGAKTVEVVVATMKRRPESMVSIRLADGRSVNCTENHPFLTRFGWVPAWRLTKQDMVLTITPNELLYLRKSKCEEAVRKSVVQISACSNDYPEHFSKAWWGNHSVPGIERNARSSHARQGINQTEGHGMEATGTRRKREASAYSTGFDGVCAGLGHGGCDTNENAKALWVSDMLQGRCGEQGFEDWSGGRRILPLVDHKETARREEGQVSGWVGVDRVEVHKQTSDGTFGGMCPDGFVYNFETSRSHTYTANGIVVHNCHHAVAGTWAKVFAQYPKARFLGVTATPERMDGRGLGELFDHLVIGPSVSDLIAQGYLATPRYFRPPNAPDVSSLHMRMGEFAMDEAEALMDKPSITGDAVAHYKQHLYPRTAVAFCISIEHAHHVSESFRANGVTSAVIDGKMTRDERREMVKDLASGAIQVLTSCDLISEGFDLPSVGGAILLRPTGSLSTHIQQIGRPLRPKKDGSKAIILDHVGNVMRHGPAEKPREWSLDSRKRTSKQENDPQNKTCRECFCIFQGPRCPQCGQAPVGKPREIEVVEGTLEEVDVAALLEKRKKRIEVGRAQSLEELIQIGKDRKYSPQWAFIRWNISPHNPRNRKQMTFA